MAGNPLYHQAMNLVNEGKNQEALDLLAPEPEFQERLRTRYIPHVRGMFGEQDVKFCSEVTALACDGELTRALKLLTHRPHPECNSRWEPVFRQNIIESNHHDWTPEEVLARGYLYAENVKADKSGNNRSRYAHWTPEDWVKFDAGLEDLRLEFGNKVREAEAAKRAEQDRRAQILKAGTYLQKQLLARGWTRTLITRLLGEPDVKFACSSGHGSYRHDYEEHHYAKARVVEAETSDEFRKYIERKALAPLRKLVKAKLENSRALASNIKIHTVHPLPPQLNRYARILAGGAEPELITRKQRRIKRKNSRYTRSPVI